MNTPSENSYYDLMSNDRIHFVTEEIKEVEYDFKITNEIMNQFNEWKIEVLETTDVPATELEMLEFFKSLKISSCGGGFPQKVKVLSIEIIEND